MVQEAAADSQVHGCPGVGTDPRNLFLFPRGEGDCDDTRMIGHPEQAKPVWEKLKAELTFGEWRDEQLDLARTLVGLARAVAKHSLVLSALEGVEVEDIAFLLGDRAPGTLRNHLSGWRRWASYCQGVRFNEIPDKVPKVPEKVGEGLVQSQVRSNRVPEKVAEKVRRFRDALVQSQVKFNRVPEKVPQKVWEDLVQSQLRFNGIIHGNPPEVFPALGFATRFSKKTLRLLGIPPKRIFIWGGVGWG